MGSRSLLVKGTEGHMVDLKGWLDRRYVFVSCVLTLLAFTAARVSVFLFLDSLLPTQPYGLPDRRPKLFVTHSQSVWWMKTHASYENDVFLCFASRCRHLSLFLICALNILFVFLGFIFQLSPVFCCSPVLWIMH